jgi:hypothetical protein
MPIERLSGSPPRNWRKYALSGERMIELLAPPVRERRVDSSASPGRNRRTPGPCRSGGIDPRRLGFGFGADDLGVLLALARIVVASCSRAVFIRSNADRAACRRAGRRA